MLKQKKLRLSILLVCICALVGIGVLACSEKTLEVPEKRQALDMSLTNNEFYLSEDTYSECIQNEVEPYLKTRMTEGTVKNGDISLAYRIYKAEDAKKSIVISHGFTEYMDKYNEVIYYYLKGGYDVYMMEHRGHGDSTREVEDTSLVYVDSFDDYQSDFKTFMDEIVVKDNGNKPMYLFAHSMGGAIATRFIEDNQGYFKAAVLSSPMLDVNTGSVPEAIANTLSKAMALIGKGKSYVLGYGPYDDTYDFEGSSSSSKVRYEYYRSKELESEKHQGNAASYAWLKAAIAETKTITSEANVKKIEIPVLLFQAENDSLVEANGLYKLANAMDNIEFVYVEGSKHQVWSTENDIMIPYFNTIFNFLEKH